MAGSIKLYYTTCGKIVDARKLAKKLLESKSAVCVNIIGDIESHFLDKKKVSCSNEVVLIIKSNLEKKKIKKIIELNHDYDIPFIIEVKTDSANKKYLNWALEVMK